MGYIREAKLGVPRPNEPLLDSVSKLCQSCYKIRPRLHPIKYGQHSTVSVRGNDVQSPNSATSISAAVAQISLVHPQKQFARIDTLL